MKVAILRDSNPESSLKWEIACRTKGLDYTTIDMLRNDCLDLLLSYSPAFCVGRPPGDNLQHKHLFDQKLFYIENYLHFPVFPGFLETWIYENKASLAYFLKLNHIPHPDTFISSSFDESMQFVLKTNYPVVAKTLIGAAGSGVKIIESLPEAEKYVRRAFTKGIKRRFGPNRKTGSAKKWLLKAVQSPEYFLNRMKQYRERDNDVQKGIVFFQQYVEHPYEWRCVKIGGSYFAYKKLKIDNQASGSKIFDYGPPPMALLDFTRNLCEKHRFNFMAVDLFHSEDQICVNELQTIFGHKSPYICKVDGAPGRYVYQDGQWIFEPGDFNTNESYDLRLETAMALYEK